MKGKLVLFLKGVLMGICDIIPGISGGSIAFITGIYYRLVNAIRNFSFKLVSNLFRYVVKRDNLDELKENVRKLDLKFLLVLFLGIISAFLVGSRVVSFLLDNYFVYTISFFIGLILASSRIIFSYIERHHSKNILFGFVGLLIGVALSFLVPRNVTPNLANVFFGGFLAVSAMFLPGVSGAFILLVIGLYEFMLKVLHDIIGNFVYFLVFSIGALLGAVFISRVVSFLFRKDRCKTLYFLLGLVVGCLSIPLKRMFEYNLIWNFFNVLIVLVLFVLGVMVVGIVRRFERRGDLG